MADNFQARLHEKRACKDDFDLRLELLRDEHRPFLQFSNL